MVKFITYSLKNEKKSIFIITKADINLYGSIELAKKLIDVAVDGNVNPIKFQKEIKSKSQLQTIDSILLQVAWA
jgi:sialic acid synthase SpsE